MPVSSMRLRGVPELKTEFVDTPKGLFTAAGVWFLTREALLEDYAGPVLEREPLPRLLAQAEMWLRSAQTLALWALPLLLFAMPPMPAALAALVIYVAWRSLGPSFVARPLVSVFRVLDVVLLQALYYVFTLSVLAAQDQIAALGVGLAGFVLLRWGLVQWATQPLVRWIWRSLYRLPVPDQVLRSLIVRAALKHRLSLPELDRMEQAIVDIWTRNKTNKTSK